MQAAESFSIPCNGEVGLALAKLGGSQDSKEGVIDRLRQLGFSVIEVNFGSKPLNDAYANKRAEMWDTMAKRLRSGGVIPNHPELKTHLCTPTYSFNSANDRCQKRRSRTEHVAW